ncbi:hypothetical protein MMC26_006914 [Xylographa opegraphella]|nr:hypothetical protein [Xylographa opegraphella]
MSADDSIAPLSGIRVVELAGLAPSPFAGLLLADYGATVLRVDRSVSYDTPSPDLLVRHKKSICLDLKDPRGLPVLRALLKHVDVLIDPYRPGVLESLGLDPNELIAQNERLIVARLTGFRRDGKYASMAGHDINYLAVSGVLNQLGRKGAAPQPPANILADFAGGGLSCAFGIMIALFAREGTGRGQIVNCNMVDGSSYLATFPRLATKTPLWNRPRGENVLDGGCPFYEIYECKDGGHMAVGALEPQFFKELLDGLGLTEFLSLQHDHAAWPSMRDAFGKKFLQRTRSEWENVFDGKDACCTPLLSYTEMEAAGYEQRHAVSLNNTPGLKLDQNTTWESMGMHPGTGGEGLLQEWLGWSHGKHYDIKRGAVVQIDIAKL